MSDSELTTNTRYPIDATASHKLSLSHATELLKLENPLERSFYEIKATNKLWPLSGLKNSSPGSSSRSPNN